MSEILRMPSPEPGVADTQIQPPTLSLEAYKRIIYGLDIADLILSNAAEGVEVKPQRVTDYGLMPLHTANEGRRDHGWAEDFPGFDYALKNGLPPATVGGAYYEIYLNTSWGFALCYKERPQAVVGMELGSFGARNSALGRRLNPDQAHIHQLQGIVGFRCLRKERVVHSRGLSRLDWTDFMVETGERIAAEAGARTMGMEDARAAYWSPLNDGRISMEQARRIYDETAKRLGYRPALMPQERLWIKELGIKLT